MPAVTVPDILVLPRLSPPRATQRRREAVAVVPAVHATEGAGFEVWRAFPTRAGSRFADPFFLLDQMGPVHYAPHEALGAPWHPHRGFETVTYMLDGSVEHHDSHGGGGIIGEGDTQWMTAGSGILHDEVPPQAFLRSGGLTHGVQLWVNLPARLKMTPPRYQAISGSSLTLLTTPDGGGLIRLIAGSLGGHVGPGRTWTPTTYAHVTLQPGAELALAWDPSFNAMAYALSGCGEAGPSRRPFAAHELVVFGSGDVLTLRAASSQRQDDGALEVLLLGGLPLNEPIYHYGPFLMNTREEILQAVEDFHAGRLGSVPAQDRQAGADAGDTAAAGDPGQAASSSGG